MKSNFKGRGTGKHLKNKFEKTSYSEDKTYIDDEGAELQKTKYISIYPKTIVNKVTSPDVGMNYSLNPYQGCEHGCTYCYARPTHEYWGYNAGIDFEQTILVKERAPELLREFLSKKTWLPSTIVLSGNTDCYQPIESKLRITRKLLTIFLECKHPVGIITKNTLISKDMDVIKELAHYNLISINLSITTLNESLRRKLEPRTASSSKKLALIHDLNQLNVPVRIMMSPIIPSLNDHEIMTIAKETAAAGANDFHTHMVRLMGSNEIVFENWLETYYPDRRQKVMNQIRSLHNGKTGSSNYGDRMKGNGEIAAYIRRISQIARTKYFGKEDIFTLRTDLFERPSVNGQMRLF